jgi:hypothetical protein
MKRRLLIAPRIKFCHLARTESFFSKERFLGFAAK